MLWRFKVAVRSVLLLMLRCRLVGLEEEVLFSRRLVDNPLLVDRSEVELAVEVHNSKWPLRLIRLRLMERLVSHLDLEQLTLPFRVDHQER